MRKKHGSVPKLHTCSGLDSHNEQKHRHSKCHYKRNPGSVPTGTNNPTRLGNPRSDRGPTGGPPPPDPATATTSTRPGRRSSFSSGFGAGAAAEGLSPTKDESQPFRPGDGDPGLLAELAISSVEKPSPAADAS